MRLLITLLVNGLLVYLAAAVLPGIAIEGYFNAIVVALLLGIANFLVRPVLFILTLPITILTLGLFLFFVNGAMVLLVDSLLSSFTVDGWFWAIAFSVIMSVFNLLFENKEAE